MPFFPTDTDAGVTRKEDGSPVTLADPASEAIIIARLKELTPNIPVIAEEQAEADLSPIMAPKDTFWLVDPLDGTKEFIKGSKDFCINIGLIENGTPVFGAMYCPATGDFYYGGETVGGAFFNDTPLFLREYDTESGFIVVTGASLKFSKRVQPFIDKYKIQSTITRGCTLKFCLIAEGKADIYPRFVPTYEWDTAAAHAILLAIGGDMIDFRTKKRLTYAKENYLNGAIVTGTNQALNHFKI